MLTEENIDKIVRNIVKNYKPERIILFGSYAYGNPTKESDIDLLKKQRYKIGRLTKDVGYGKKGDICLFHRSKEYIDPYMNGYESPVPGGWSGQFDIRHITTDGKYHDYYTVYVMCCEELKEK